MSNSDEENHLRQEVVVDAVTLCVGANMLFPENE